MQIKIATTAHIGPTVEQIAVAMGERPSEGETLGDWLRRASYAADVELMRRPAAERRAIIAIAIGP